MSRQRKIKNRSSDRAASSGSTANTPVRRAAPPIVRDALKTPGQPLDEATQAFMERRFSHDFSSIPAHGSQAPEHAGLSIGQVDDPAEQAAERTAATAMQQPGLSSAQGRRRDLDQVRIHTDAQAAASAHQINARAYTVGRDIAFAAGEYAPETSQGQALLAHELAHVGQQRPGVVARKVADNYSTVEDKLTYGFLDWAITDQDAHEVLLILSGLSDPDFADTVQKMETDGLVDRLIENVSDADNTAFAPLVQKIQQARRASAVAGQIEQLMSYGVLDWVITDREAHMALEALKSLQPQPAKLRDVVVAIPAKQYERFYDNLSAEDRSANLRFLQDIEIMRRTGMTFAELSATQKAHLEAEATAAGVSVGEHIRGEAASRGYGGNPVTWWPSLTPDQKKAWTDRFDKIVQRLRTEAIEDVRNILISIEKKGGGIHFEPELTEELGAYAVNHGTILGVGKSWLLAAEKNLENVYENVVHELGGHQEFGATASWDIMKGTLASLPAGERAIAESGPRRPFTAYGYMETELYAELRELPYRTPGSQGDDPAKNVPEMLEKIKQAFAPTVAEGIVRGFRRRIQIDPLIVDAARTLFDQAASDVFGITF